MKSRSSAKVWLKRRPAPFSQLRVSGRSGVSASPSAAHTVPESGNRTSSPAPDTQPKSAQ